jgi:hypothetical protein
MKKHIKLWLRYRIARVRVVFRRLSRNFEMAMDSKLEQSDTKDLALAIVRRAIACPTAVMLIAPISGTRYIQFDDIFIKLTENLITIVNGSYTYQISISDKETEFLLEKFNFRLEFIRKQWEASIMTKTKKSLTTILEDLNSKFLKPI